MVNTVNMVTLVNMVTQGRTPPSRIALVATFGLGLAALLLAGCDDRGSSPDTPSAGASAASASPSGGIAAEAEPVPKEPAHPFAGRWKASIQVGRGEVEVPEGVPYRPWVKDDGSASAGRGELSVEVAPDGAVTGRGAGALGALALRGRIEGDTLRAGVTPSDAAAPDGMRGVLVATKTGDDLVGELRVSGHDGTVVRVADVRFARPSAEAPPQEKGDEKGDETGDEPADPPPPASADTPVATPDP